MKTIFSNLRQLPLLAAILLTAVTASAGNVRYVKQTASGTGDGSSWANASSDLQAMLTASTNGDSVWVAAGTYFPSALPPGTTTVTTTSRDYAFYVPPGVRLYGGFAGNEMYVSERNLALNITILDGDTGIQGNVTDNCHHVLIFAVSGPANSSGADGLTIKNGNANGTGSITVAGQNYSRVNGGGIYSFQCQVLYLYNLNLKDNRCTTKGGGAFLSTLNSLNLYYCIISGNLSSTGNSEGGGIYLTSCSGTVRGNTFRNNVVSGVIAGNGGGLFHFTGTLYILNNSFYNNSCSNTGGGIYYNTGNAKVCNNVFYNNQAAVRGGGLAVISAASDTIANNTFFANNAVSGGGGFNSNTPNTSMYNNIFQANMLNGNNSIPGADYSRQSGAAIAKNNLFQLAASSYTATDLGAAAVNNLFQLDPLFTNSSMPAGLDGIDRTADDGLVPLSCSPAVNSGDQLLLPAVVTYDITDNSRTQLGFTDMGAYERSNINPDVSASITTAAISITKTQSGTVVYSNDCNTLVTSVISSGASPVSGSTTSRIWIETVQPSRFLKRHYEITPASNAASATGRITLYFTQQEFDDFNAVNTVKLPQDPTDAAGHKTNLLIEKRAGTSSDGSGLPASYTGTVSLIDPADTDIIWNASRNRWEVSFDVTGFSGFFVKSTPQPLSIKWISFSGELNNQKQAVLTWKVEELNVTRYEIEKSYDGTAFTVTGSVPGKGDGAHTYTFTEPMALQSAAYYRIRQTEADGRTSYSSIILLKTNNENSIAVYPNPVSRSLNISCTKNQSAIILDASGKTIKTLMLVNGVLSLDTEPWSRGLYLLKAESGETIKLIKE